MAEPMPEATPSGASSPSPARPPLSSAAALLVGAAALFLVWKTAGTLLLIFAGLLFGAFLEAGTRGLGYVLPIGRGWRLSLVCIILTLAATWVLIWSGYNVVAEADGLIRLIDEQLRVLRGELTSMGLPPPDPDRPRTLAQLILPDPSALFGHAYAVFSIASGVLGAAIVVVFVGLFLAASPGTYRRGVLSLVPRPRRQRVGEVLDEMARALRWWLAGQLVAVIIIALSTWIGLAAIGMPGALLLGIQAGLVNFIPYLGPVIAAVPILLAAMAQGTSMALWALGVHVVIQTLEGYVLAPLIQRRAVDVPPVLTLAAVMIFGALFGAIGIALATPLVAVLKIAVVRLYVEDRLGGGVG
jgi:predicted PurR-regulated permease PerM